MNKSLEKNLSFGIKKIFTRDRSTSIVRTLEKIATKTGIYDFDIFNIPDKQHVLAYNHGFKLFGKVADAYVLGPGAKRPVIGLFYPKLLENPLYKLFLESWGGVPTNKLKCLQNYIHNGEIIMIAPSGPEHMPNPRGELGAAWIAKNFQMPIIPTVITQGEGYVSVKPKKEIHVPRDSTKKDLRNITNDIMEELR